MLDYAKGRAFLKKMSSPCIVHHADSDGVCSAVLIAKFLRYEGIEPAFISPNDGPGIDISKGLVAEISSSLSSVFLDMQVDSLGIVEKLNCERNFILDHHLPVKDLNTMNTMHMNPRFIRKDAYIPTSYLAYHLCSPSTEGFEWIALVGIVGDRGYAESRDVIEKAKKKYPGLISSTKDDDLQRGTFGILSEMIEASKAVKSLEGIRRAFSVFSDASEPKDVMDSFLMRWRDDFRNEAARIEADFEQSAERFRATNSFIYSINSKYHMSSFISNILADKHPDAAIFIVKKGDGVKVSARCQSGRVNVAKLLEETALGIGRGGGHPKAAGAYVPHKTAEFMDRLRERLQKPIS